MTQINEAHKSRILGIELLSSEEAIGQCYGSTFIDETDTFDSSDLTSIKICLPLHITSIRRNREHNLIGEHLRLLEIGLELLQEVSEYLFGTHDEFLASASNFNPYFLVVYFLRFVCNELFLLFVLLRTFSV